MRKFFLRRTVVAEPGDDTTVARTCLLRRERGIPVRGPEEKTRTRKTVGKMGWKIFEWRPRKCRAAARS